ncbi:DUF427 domain-containing protein [Amycolatopsis albispora]|uniref:DUF427 domain-containing protein n=1 Tax=Amycolatopsis albispora TaxID=1804986 RepID=A0A344L9D8_9PSEU|nr:DUF427 domain-containing protein [Amycolatopsis albispora]AXB44662.1 hypothetical protein A4R43_20930 [Amycolatopsis albispora]
MPDRKVLVPGPDHPITIEPNPNRIVVTAGGRTIADTTGALTLREATYPPVAYLPREDVDFSALERTDHQTYCPYKGEAAYYTVAGGGENAVWTYDTPYDAVAQIKGYVAFYPDRVDQITETPR